MRGLRFVEIRGDALQPLMRTGDFVLVATTNRWDGDGLYVTSDVYAEDAVYDCSVAGTRGAPQIRLGSLLEIAGRKAYTDQFVTRAEFERIVTGKVLVTCQVRDHALFHRFALAA